MWEKSVFVLLRKLSEISGICWICIVYCYSKKLFEIYSIDERGTKDLLLSGSLSFNEHRNDNILKKMGLQPSKAELKVII